MKKRKKQAGVITQKAISVRIDMDLWEFLQLQRNKNRFINDCIRKVLKEIGKEGE